MQNLMPPIDTTDHAFHDGDPTTGQLGTIVTAAWLNDVQGATRDIQAEIIAVLTKAGMQPNPQKQNQLAEAISQIIGSGGYATSGDLTLGLSKKIDKADIAQQLGNDTAKVPSLQLVTTELGKKAGIADVAGKLDKSAVVQTTGISATDVMSQKAVSQALDQKAGKNDLIGKIDNTSVVQDTGTSSSLIMSQKAVTENTIPVGTVIFVSHDQNVTGRFLKTHGTAVSRTVYADLFAAIGTTYGTGDGSTTFNLPDTREEFPRFTGGGRAVGSKQSDATRNFNGSVSGRTATSTGRIFARDATGVFGTSDTNGSMLDNGSVTSPLPSDRLGTLTIDLSRQLQTANEFRPRNIAFAGWIKY